MRLRSQPQPALKQLSNMADTKADVIRSEGNEVSQSPDALNFEDGLDAVEASGTVNIGIKDDGVTNAKIADNAVSLENLDSAITPAFICVGGVLHTWDAGAATTDTATISGVLATDIIVGNFTTTNTNGVTIEQIARTGTDTVTITTSANAADNDVIAIAAFRAAA